MRNARRPTIEVLVGGLQDGKVLRSAVEFWRQVHTWPRRARWPLKLSVVALACLLILYPRLWLLPAWVQRLRDMDSVLDANCPGLVELEASARTEMPRDPTPEQVRTAVERAVYARIPYAFDWDTWGVVDYLPTVQEVFELGREDCDGRAVVAASLLRRMGYQASLASDLKHVWVVTPAFELMSPGTGPKTLVGDQTGTRATITPQTLAGLGRAITYGIAVFPLPRECILLGVLCGVALNPWSPMWRRVLGCALMVLALGLLRFSGPSAEGLAARPALVWIGLAAAVGGWLLLVIRAGGAHSPSTRLA